MLLLLLIFLPIGLYLYFPRIARALVGLTFGLVVLAVVTAMAAGVYWSYTRPPQSVAASVTPVAVPAPARLPSGPPPAPPFDPAAILRALAADRGDVATPDEAAQTLARLRQRHPTE